VAECSEMVRKIDTSLKEGLKRRNKRASETLQNEKGNTITACCLERVQLLNYTKNLLLRNQHGGGHFRWV
jgi:hypothetical protein